MVVWRPRSNVWRIRRLIWSIIATVYGSYRAHRDGRHFVACRAIVCNRTTTNETIIFTRFWDFIRVVCKASASHPCDLRSKCTRPKGRSWRFDGGIGGVLYGVPDDTNKFFDKAQSDNKNMIRLFFAVFPKQISPCKKNLVYMCCCNRYFLKAFLKFYLKTDLRNWSQHSIQVQKKCSFW